MLTTYDFIEQNKRRTWLLVLLFPVTFAMVGFLFLFAFAQFTDNPSATTTEQSYYQTTNAADMGEETPLQRATRMAMVVLPVLWLFAMVWILISYYEGDQLLLNGAEAVEISKKEQPEIFRLVENLCIASGLPLPRIYLINDESLNAFATGRDPEHASVALTVGIVKRLERAELEGVIAHELSHIQNHDIRLMLITVAGISFFTYVAEFCFACALYRGRRRSSKNEEAERIIFLILGIVFAMYGYLIAPLIRLAVSRTREYQADASAALMTRNPGALARALQKISDDPRVEVLDQHASMAAMCIANPLEKMGLFSSISGLFATHPPIENRIMKLRIMDADVLKS